MRLSSLQHSIQNAKISFSQPDSEYKYVIINFLKMRTPKPQIIPLMFSCVLKSNSHSPVQDSPCRGFAAQKYLHKIRIFLLTSFLKPIIKEGCCIFCQMMKGFFIVLPQISTDTKILLEINFIIQKTTANICPKTNIGCCFYFSA